MADLTFLYIAFFLTLGAFLLGFISSWNLKSIFDEWKERAEYAAVVMHPEMYDDDGELTDQPLYYLRFHEEDDMIDDED
jgi:hypothetical protein